MNYEFEMLRHPIGEGVAPKAKGLILLGIKERYYRPYRLAGANRTLDGKPEATNAS